MDGTRPRSRAGRIWKMSSFNLRSSSLVLFEWFLSNWRDSSPVSDCGATIGTCRGPAHPSSPRCVPGRSSTESSSVQYICSF